MRGTEACLSCCAACPRTTSLSPRLKTRRCQFEFQGASSVCGGHTRLPEQQPFQTCSIIQSHPQSVLTFVCMLYLLELERKNRLLFSFGSYSTKRVKVRSNTAVIQYPWSSNFGHNTKSRRAQCYPCPVLSPGMPGPLTISKTVQSLLVLRALPCAQVLWYPNSVGLEWNTSHSISPRVSALLLASALSILSGEKSVSRR